MSTPVLPRPGSHRHKPLLGLRRKPGRLALAVFRMPLGAYRHGAGWPLGRTLLEFVHTGRKTGRPYQTVAMVLRHDADAHNAVICAGWDPGRLRLISTILGWGDLRDDAASPPEVPWPW